MDPITLGLIGAGVGVAKHQLIDAPQEKRDRQLAATTAQYSPWTGMRPDAVAHTNAAGSALQGGVAGAQFGQNLQNQQMQGDMWQKMMQQQQGGGMGAPMPMTQLPATVGRYNA